MPKKKSSKMDTGMDMQKLREKDPEFYEFLKEHDKGLLDFEPINQEIDEELDEGDIDDEVVEGDDEDDDDDDVPKEKKKKKKDAEKKLEPQGKKVITVEMVNTWIELIREGTKISPVYSIMQAYRTACHYGDEGEDDSTEKYRIMSGAVFNKILQFVLSEIDGILRKLLDMPATGGKKETIVNLMSTKKWKTYNHLIKSYLGNSLHVLNQMTDPEMISFTLRRLKYSAVFLAGFPTLLRKYMKVSLHFWGTGGGALPIVSFLFIRDLCIRLGSDCLDECFKGMYKAYVTNCQFVNATKLQHLQFLRNCVVELYVVDLPTAYQHAFVFIRQLAMILREALSTKTKEAFRKVYEWKYINCLELWTGAVCAYSSEPDFRPLAYPLTQIIFGVTRLVPTARYFPLRLRCVKMLNRIAASLGTFIPVSLPLLDMLEMKELNKKPTGGVGKAVDLRTTLKVSKPALKTRAFQEACVFAVMEELAEHLSQWSYSVAFFELAFIPTVRLRSFCKSTNVERFRKETKQLVREIEANSEFMNSKRATISYLPNDPAAESYLEVEKEKNVSPLSQYVVALRQRAQERHDSISESSVIVGANSSVFGKKKSVNDEDDDSDGDAEEGPDVFSSSSWLPGSDSKTKEPKGDKKSKKKKKQHEEVAIDEDIVGELVLSSDDEEVAPNDSSSDEREEKAKSTTPTQAGKKRKFSSNSSKKGRSKFKKSKK
ncbi:hypothetical protein MKW94_023788 [Papaver nudicaule]|uniref:Nucleolar complex protein 2 homolog n=1 Tax=Papaver nudicaule TaxID=74823 RepID=A0AA41S6M0_PAPNU|nr:hypothetical protein [Papaver nudicaule]